MQLGNISRDSYDVLLLEVQGNSSKLLFSRVASVANVMGHPLHRLPHELNGLLKPYRDDKPALFAATAAWMVAVLTADSGSIPPLQAAKLVTDCVQETHPHAPLPMYRDFEIWLREARSENHPGDWPVIAAVWFAAMTYPYEVRKMSLHRTAAMLGKVAAEKP